MATLVLWHGYLLGGTGSNIYTANIVDEWVKAGHQVILMCQDPHPELFPVIDSWQLVKDGLLVKDRVLHVHGTGNGSCTMVQADLSGLLPVYLLDRYEGFHTVKRFVDLNEHELENYRAANAKAMRYVIDTCSPDAVLINHAVMGPETLRPVLQAAGIPYAVKIHGSELEYTIAENSDYVAPAQSGLEGAVKILVGSEHINTRMNELLGTACSSGRVALVPPGVDLELFHPIGHEHRAEYQSRLVELLRSREATSAGRAQSHQQHLVQSLAVSGDYQDIVARVNALNGTYQEREPEVGVADIVQSIDFESENVVVIVGKTIHQKGQQLVLMAAPLVLAQHPNVRFAFVGFGGLRDGFAAMVEALADNNLELLDAIVKNGHRFDSNSTDEFAYVGEFLASMRNSPQLEEYLVAARAMRDRIVWFGQVTHDVLALLWPLCTTSIVPSVSAEAFGMVSAEAAACGCPPVLADHSGLADVANALIEGYPEHQRDLVSFQLSNLAVNPIEQLASVVNGICELDQEAHTELGEFARSVVEGNWSWTSISAQIVAMIERPLADRAN